MFLELVQSVGQSGGGWFVDDAFNAQTGEFSSLLRRVSLSIVEIGRHRDDRSRDLLAQRGLGVGF